MVELIQFLAQNPSMTVTVSALALTCLFAYLLFGAFKDRLINFEKSFDTQTDTINATLNDVKEQISDHKTALGKATKAMDGEILKVQEKILDLKHKLFDEINRIKDLGRDSARTFESAINAAQLAIEDLNKKLERLELFEKKLQSTTDKVFEFRQTLSNQTRTLERLEAQIQELEGKIDKKG